MTSPLVKFSSLTEAFVMHQFRAVLHHREFLFAHHRHSDAAGRQQIVGTDPKDEASTFELRRVGVDTIDH